MRCPVCRQSTEDGNHGPCVEKLAAENERLRALLIDAGIMRKGSL